MDVAVTELRKNLSHWLARVVDGDEVVVTDRGVPVARMIGLGSTSTIEELTINGVIGRPVRAARPVAGGRAKPRSKRPVADVVSAQRR